MESVHRQTTDARIHQAYADMAAFEDAPGATKPPQRDCAPAEQFKVDLVAWYIERLRRMGRPVDAAWLMYELLYFCIEDHDLHRDIDAFIQETVLGQLFAFIWEEVGRNNHARAQFIRITDAFVAFLGSIE